MRSSAFGAIRTRPAVIIPDASFDVVSVLEEHRVEFPGLIIQSAPKRIYPDGEAVARSSATRAKSANRSWRPWRADGYKPGQHIGKSGFEKQYETDVARARRRSASSRSTRAIESCRTGSARGCDAGRRAAAVHEHRSRSAGVHPLRCSATRLGRRVVAMVPQTGEVLALYSSPSIDPNRFVGGVSHAYYDSSEQRSAQAAVQQGAPGRVSAGLDVQARDGVDGARGQPRRRSKRTCRSRARAFYYFGNRCGDVGRKRATAVSTLTQRDRAVVRRVLLPARPEARRSAPRRRRRVARLRQENGHRPAGRKAAAVPHERSRSTSIRSTARAAGHPVESDSISRSARVRTRRRCSTWRDSTVRWRRTAACRRR